MNLAFKTAVFIILICPVISFGQVKKTRLFYPWLFKEKAIDVNGMSIGVFSFQPWNEEIVPVNINGARIEIFGAGIIIPLVPNSPILTNDSSFLAVKKQKRTNINGLALSGAGMVCDCQISGLSVGMIGKIDYRTNGISIAMINVSQVHNGLQLALFNEVYKSNGLQLGLFNNGVRLGGVQIGVSNFGLNVKGFQVGIFNKSNELKGMQLGLWNINQKRKFPLINWNL